MILAIEVAERTHFCMGKNSRLNQIKVNESFVLGYHGFFLSLFARIILNQIYGIPL